MIIGFLSSIIFIDVFQSLMTVVSLQPLILSKCTGILKAVDLLDKLILEITIWSMLCYYYLNFYGINLQNTPLEKTCYNNNKLIC